MATTNGDSASTEEEEAEETSGPSLLTRLSDDFLQCPMCRQRYSEPRLLTCLHAVCRACLESLRRLALDRQRFRLSFVSVECPSCRRLTDVTPGVDRLPSDSVRARLLEVVTIAEAATTSTALTAASAASGCEMCAHSGRDRQATGRCLDCGKLLCPPCRQRHRKVRVTSDHELVDLDRQTALNCDRHPSELVRFYCTSCQVPVCIGCTFSNAHSSHTVLKFKDAAQQKADELEEFSRRCSEKLQQLGSALQLARGLESQIASTEAAIKEAANNQTAAIRAAQKTLLDELREFYDACSDLLAGRHEIAAALRDLTEVSSFGELLRCSKYSESLLLAPRISTALTRYADFQPPEVPVKLRRYRLQFLPGSEPVLGRLDRQKVTESWSSSSSSISRSGSICFPEACRKRNDSDCSSCASGTEVSSLGDAQESATSEVTPERSFFTYDNSTLRSSVCRSLTTDTLVAAVADVECQTDFCLSVNLGFALISVQCSEATGSLDSGERLLEFPPPLLVVCHQSLMSGDTSGDFSCIRFCDLRGHLFGLPLVSTQHRMQLHTGLCTVQECLLAPEVFSQSLPTYRPMEPLTRSLLSAPSQVTCSRPAVDKDPIGTTTSEVRVCSVMFSSLESNEFDELELARPPTLLQDAACQTEAVSGSASGTQTEAASVASEAAAAVTRGTQTPHLPARRDLVACSSQTVAFALFSRDTQARPDTEDRWSQTRPQQRHYHGFRLDKATQWETAATAVQPAQRLYRSGRVISVVGAASAAATVCERLALSPRSPRRLEAQSANAEVSEPQLNHLTETLSQKVEFQPLVLPKTHSHLAAASCSSSGTPSASGSSSGSGRDAPGIVRFPKPKSEELSSMDKLKNFCVRLRQRRSVLGRQKIEVVKDK